MADHPDPGSIDIERLDALLTLLRRHGVVRFYGIDLLATPPQDAASKPVLGEQWSKPPTPPQGQAHELSIEEQMERDAADLFGHERLGA